MQAKFEQASHVWVRTTLYLGKIRLNIGLGQNLLQERVGVLKSIVTVGGNGSGHQDQVDVLRLLIKIQLLQNLIGSLCVKPVFVLELSQEHPGFFSLLEGEGPTKSCLVGVGFNPLSKLGGTRGNLLQLCMDDESTGFPEVFACKEVFHLLHGLGSAFLFSLLDGG